MSGGVVSVKSRRSRFLTAIADFAKKRVNVTARLRAQGDWNRSRRRQLCRLSGRLWRTRVPVTGFGCENLRPARPERRRLPIEPPVMAPLIGPETRGSESPRVDLSRFARVNSERQLSARNEAESAATPTKAGTLICGFGFSYDRSPVARRIIASKRGPSKLTNDFFLQRPRPAFYYCIQPSHSDNSGY